MEAHSNLVNENGHIVNHFLKYGATTICVLLYDPDTFLIITKKKLILLEKKTELKEIFHISL